MKKIALFIVAIMLVTSFMGIFSIEGAAASIPEKPNDFTAPVITTVTGLFLDFQKTTFMVSFYALRIHYWTIGPFRHVSGVINLKSCTGGMIVGPYSLIWLGPLHNIEYGTFTFVGDIQYYSGSFGR